jgi:hypothetical protein
VNPNLAPALLREHARDSGDREALLRPGNKVAAFRQRAKYGVGLSAGRFRVSESRAQLARSTEAIGRGNFLRTLVRHNVRSMARPSDATRAARTLRPIRICEMAGVSRQTRQKWVDRQLLAQRSECGELELIELVVLRALYASIRKSHVPIAWGHVQPRLRDAIPAESVTVVWDMQTRVAVLASEESDVFALVAHGRPVQVLDLGTEIALARQAFRNEVDTQRATRRTSSRTAAPRSSSHGGKDH